MILTLTPNAALDRLLFIAEFRPGTTMRPEIIIDKVGGKALDASVALRGLGVETLALSFVAGEVGRRLVKLLDSYGVKHDLIWLEGETRISHVLVETRHRRHSHITAGVLPLPSAAAAELLQRYQAHVANAAWVIAGGSLPPGAPDSYYRSIVEIANQAGRPILIDSVGPPVLASLSRPPAILKMNWGEFVLTFDASASTLSQLRKQARAVFKREKLAALVLTCGEQGILALTPEGDYLAAAPIQPVVNAAGAGDAASGALAWRFAAGDNWPEALRWTAAVSAAAVLTKGTADCHMAAVERILPQTRVRCLGNRE